MRWRELFPTRAAIAIAAFACVIAPTTLVVLQIDANPKLSPIDEAAHLDYVERVSNGEIPRQGQRLTKATLRVRACRGSVLASTTEPPCSTQVLSYDQFSSIYQYEAQQPPTYYALTAPARWAVQKVTGVGVLDATRLVGIAWLAAGLLLLWAAGRLMAIDPLALGAALLLLVVSPTVVYGTATVTNDVTAVFAAGLVALVAALAYRRAGPRVPIALFAAGFAAAACKTTNLFPVVAVSGLFAVGAIARRDPRGWLRDGGPLLAGGLLAAVAWGLVHRSRALIDLKDEPTFEVLRGVPRGLGLVVREAAGMLQPITGLSSGLVSLTGETLNHNAQTPFYAALTFLLIGAGLTGLFTTRRGWPHVLGLIAVPTIYVGGVVFGAGLMITYDIDPSLSGRYALSMAPLLLLVLAALLEEAWTRWALALFAGAFFLTTFAVMVT